MAAKEKQKLRIPLVSSEMELLERAARLADTDDLPTWAKRVLLEAARKRAEEGQETIMPGDDKPPSSRPQCTCGATSNPTGQCDGSCIMRF
jgi:hypothetical protein